MLKNSKKVQASNKRTKVTLNYLGQGNKNCKLFKLRLRKRKSYSSLRGLLTT